ncbi:bifunctional enoyl-CoA hydratase/phosphate acetyltransferase [Methylocystis sp. WRRC1]|uniref:bifunctional enoyl-CoA hydratase/phosphate acetyltransferase n=1 Tax=Methylocystis sp. WRRC1 TaxID=1732014 RepID=UPI001D13CC1A|nr:bifunctional enoyl-CoA hydratase/phosphate acetyltransferase [Methylocystis sp. WRRC1]MCC3246064.1 bifunctional enoyl-CoA hydratase/phosphate acetyltransferase [Methylocystis sp. WRRC1]
MKIEGKTFEALRVGDAAQAERNLQPKDMRAWAAMSGAAAGGDQQAVVVVAALFSSLAATALPGPGSLVTSCLVQIRRALPVGAPLTLRLTLREKRQGNVVALDGQCVDSAGACIATATLEATAPVAPVAVEVADHRLDSLLARCAALKPMRTGVVHPCSVAAIAGALEAREAGLIEPVLFGPQAEIAKLAEGAKLDLSKCTIVSTADSEESAAKAAAAAGAGDVQALMKGSLHTDVLLHAVMQKEARLRTGRLLSHCAAISIPTYARSVVLTDVALNIAPDTDQKKDICQNAIGFARALGVETPKVAVLAAVETVRTKMPATLDGAILAKMADRRQIVGGIVDGPLDLDAAVDADAARIKHIVSPVAGAADVLIAPNIEAGNMIYKDLAFMADAQTAGLVVGARVPVILTSRADGPAARRFSAAAAVLYADALAREPDTILPETAE